MGSCLSTNTSSKHPKTSKISNPSIKNSNISKLPSSEEEIVKKVLSESCTIPKSPSSRAQPNCQIDSPFIKNATLLLPDFAKNANAQQNGAVHKKSNATFDCDENSEDASESVSVSTNVTEKRGEKNYEHHRGSSPAKRKNTTRRDNTVGRSPTRRFEPSPGRARPGPGSGNVSRDSGEISGRRSMSPVRMDYGPSKMGSGRSPSSRKTGRSPGRVGSNMKERTREVNEKRSKSGDKKWPAATEDESLENPLVSLECFIFV